MTDQRILDSIAIKKAYEEAEQSLAKVGKLLRTTEAGKFLWANDHKSAITGLKVILKQLRRNVPTYKPEDKE